MQDFVVHRLYVKPLDHINAGLSYVSDPINIQSISLYSLQVSWSAFSAVNPVVAISVSNSLDEEFVQIDSFIPSGTTGGRIINVEKAGYAFVKITYSCTSGSGTITASINGKV